MLPPASPARDSADPHLAAALAAAAERVDPARVEQAWIFPPRRTAVKESGLAVLVVRADDAADQRRTIWTVRYEVPVAKGVKPVRADTLEEQGTVPPDRVGRIVDGVVRRLEAEAEAPDVRDLDGDAEAWRALLAELGAPAVDAGNQ